MSDTGELVCGIIIGILALFLILGIGVLAGREWSDRHYNPVIVAELSNGGFVIEDDSGEQTIVHWEVTP